LIRTNTFIFIFKYIEKDDIYGSVVPNMGGTTYGLIGTPSSDGPIPTRWNTIYVSDSVTHKINHYNSEKIILKNEKISVDFNDANPDYLSNKLSAGIKMTVTKVTKSGKVKVKLTATDSN